MIMKIKDLVAEMEMQMDEFYKYLNKETGLIVTVSKEEMAIAEESEEDDDFSQYPDWQRASIKDAFDIDVNWDKYIGLPDKQEIDEYRIMERFCNSLDNGKISAALYDAINGKGAFRRFKYTVNRYGIEDRWYSYREEALRGIAISWCERNSISYTQ
ncbi:MAG: UPF0158 family protein [Pelosinus sp.]|nr:UPF0158 family protein [Pelosinus sp.]